MDSEDSRDATGDAHSTSSSSSTSFRSRRSSSSDNSKKDPKSPPRSPPSPRFNGPRSPSPESHSQLSHISTSIGKQPQSPDYLSGANSDFNSTRSTPDSPRAPNSPPAPKSPSENASNAGSPEPPEHYTSEPPFAREGPKTPQSPNSSVKSLRGSPSNRSQPVSPDSASQVTSPIRNPEPQSPTSNPSPDRASSQSSPPRSPIKKTEWSPKEKWRRHTKAEQKMVSAPRNRSRSESSQSSRSSSYNKRTSSKDPAMEAISDGEMESDQDDNKSRSKSITSDKPEKDHNISHEDLSDVSDVDSDGPDETEKESKNRLKSPSTEMKNQAVNGKDGESTQQSPKSDGVKEVYKLEKVPQEKISNTEDGEEQLDFEAEEGECIEPKAKDQANGDVDVQTDMVEAGRRSRGSSLEEGEVSDEGERRPEESEPRPVCRFFSRGVCTWGVSCRFLHPGVTDKGNYNMFEVVRGVPPAGPFPPPRDTAPPESAWERGLRTAKEMLRIANKRKEQDMDFEEKKLHLSVGGVVHDPDAELAYAAAAVGASPPRDIPPIHRDPEMYRPHGVMYRGGRFPRPPMDERERYYERERGYERERIYERPPYFEEHMAAPEEIPYHKRRVRSSREVIVQRAEVERREGREGRESRETRGREGRGDEWADPWMRAEPAARRRRPPSSEDSYSSSSSRSSGSPGARRKRRASSSSRQRLSPSVIVRERRLATARATAMNPPAPRRRAPSPGATRQLAVNPPPPPHRHKDEIDPYGRNKLSSRSRNRKKYSRSSSSGSESSTSTSESESESRSSSSSGSSGARRARHARLLNAAARPRISAKANSGMAAAVSTVTNKKEASIEKEILSKKRSATSPVRGEAPAKKSVSRREELLKQLKAVEDAIARKRSKI